MDKTIKNFDDKIRYFTLLYKNSNEKELQEFAQDTVKYFVGEIIKMDPSKKGEYVNKLNEVGISEIIENTIDEKSNEAIEYVNEKIYNGNDSYVIRDFNNLFEQLKTDMENSNDKLIETWVSNYKSFVVSNNLDEEIMFNYMEYIFNSKYNYSDEKLFDFYQIKIGKTFTTDEKIDIPEEKTEKEETIEREDEKIDIPEEKIEKEETIEREDEKIDIPEEKTEKEETIEKFEDDKGKKKVEDEKRISSTPLKIVNIKKTTKINNGLAAISIGLWAAFGTTVAGWALPFVFYYVTKKLKDFGYSKKLQKIMDENNWTIQFDETKEGGVLIDSKTNLPINIDTIDKSRYESIKDNLIKIGAMQKDNELIPSNYKKAKLTQKLVIRAKEYFKKRKERFNLINNATTLSEKENLKNSSLKFDEDKGTYDIDLDTSEDVYEEEKGRTL